MFLADLGEIAHAGRGRIGDKSETVPIGKRCHRCSRRGSRDRDLSRVLDEIPTHLIDRFIGCISGDHPAPLQLKRVDDPLYEVDWPTNAHDAVRDCEGVIDAEVLYANSGASVI